MYGLAPIGPAMWLYMTYEKMSVVYSPGIANSVA